MTHYKLSYFDMHGGRGETARIAFTAAGIPFEDDRIPFASWGDRKAEMPFHAIPVLFIDGAALAQSNGINRYVGKIAGLYPEDALQAAFCDEAMDAIEDVAAKFVPTFEMEEPEKKAAREALVAGPLPAFITAIAARLTERGGEWFADGRLTVADIRVFLWARYVRSGIMDYLPTDLLDPAPSLVSHFERVSAHPIVRSYYASRGM